MPYMVFFSCITCWDAVEKYVTNALVYLASEEREPGGLVGEQAILNAVRGLENWGHTIVVDIFLQTSPLLCHCWHEGFGAPAP